ncbi:MAG: adenine phosphoribosyltransferase [Planctomycetes bacterium]|jgi:adenine phosphoribosyltransferase|nr:adenine phosphoribosyltransferase [Planctomycetota bacterium]
MHQSKDLKRFIRDIPDFPEPGILFRDITPLLADKDALKTAIEALAKPFRQDRVQAVAAVEARGFIFGSAVARALDAGFVPIRKQGKLPWQTAQLHYELEYGEDTIEVHRDAIRPGMRVLMIDDLLATGGTMVAACKLMEMLEADIVGLTFLVELSDLAGRDRLKPYRIHSVITY